MNQDEYLSYALEIHELEQLLQEVPKDRIIERMSLEARLKSAKKAIEGVKESDISFPIRLTFRGKPVVHAHGVEAEFGLKAVNAFSEAILAIGAGISMDPIPDKQKNQLLITGIGSFGFEFEISNEVNENHSSEQRKPLENAIKIFQNLLNQIVVGSDDDIAELMDEIPPRAIKKTAEFLHFVAQNEAWCGLNFKEKEFQFQNLDQLKAAYKRLEENNIQERKETFEGEFQGILSFSREFE